MDELQASQTAKRRSGGRLARQKERSRPLAVNRKPIRPGLVGGGYQPLAPDQITAISDTVFQILEEIGLSQAPQSGIDYMVTAGAVCGNDGRVRFPRALVEDTIAIAARNLTLHAHDPEHDLLLSGARVHFGTAGAAVHVVDINNHSYRESHLKDIL